MTIENILDRVFFPQYDDSKKKIVGKILGTSIGLTSMYVGYIVGIYFAIDAILKSIEKSKILYNQKILDLNNQIDDVLIKIKEEFERLNLIPRYSKLNDLLELMLLNVQKDSALNKFLLKNSPLDIKSYYKYCGYYLKGNFNSWPFAEDHYRTEWYPVSYNVCTTDYIYNYYYDAYGKQYYTTTPVEYCTIKTDWYSKKVYDYTEYFEVNGSVDKETAIQFCNLYEEKLKFEEYYDKLVNQKIDLQDQVKNLGTGAGWKIAGIVFISLGGLFITGCFLIGVLKLGFQSYVMWNKDSNEHNFESDCAPLPFYQDIKKNIVFNGNGLQLIHDGIVTK